jgi:hypothetical protein
MIRALPLLILKEVQEEITFIYICTLFHSLISYLDLRYSLIIDHIRFLKILSDPVYKVS